MIIRIYSRLNFLYNRLDWCRNYICLMFAYYKETNLKNSGLSENNCITSIKRTNEVYGILKLIKLFTIIRGAVHKNIYVLVKYEILLL